MQPFLICIRFYKLIASRYFSLKGLFTYLNTCELVEALLISSGEMDEDKTTILEKDLMASGISSYSIKKANPSLMGMFKSKKIISG